MKRAPFLWGALVPLLLLYVVSVLLRWQVYLLRAVVVEPFVLMLWRSRRYLADAVAVQLTRQPNALRSALDRLGPASAAAFPGPTRSSSSAATNGDASLSAHPSLASRRRRLVAMGATPGVEEESATATRASFKVGLLALVLVPIALVMGSLMLYVVAMSFLLALAPAVLLTALALLAVASFLL